MKMENGISTDILQTNSHQETKPKPAQEDEFATLGAFLASLSEAIPKNPQSSPKKEAISSSDHSPSLEAKDQRPSPSKLAPKKRFANFEPDNNHVSLMEKLIAPKLATKDEKSSDFESSLLHDERTAQTIKNEIDALSAEQSSVPMSVDKTSDSNQIDDPNMTHKRKGLNDDDWRPGHGIMKKKQKKLIKKKVKPTSRREIGDEKLSFQEAAVQVLEEQREKGIQALSTRRIWELISQSGLVDTKCKTPVSSLSSRITEDVRTKGNKSVFVRVGEGLYTLRKGLKKADLEKFLSTKYPNLAHAKIDYDKFSDDGSGDEPEAEDSNTEESQEKEVKEKISSPESSPPMKEPPAPVLATYTHHIHTRERDQEVLNYLPSWIGLPLKTKRTGEVYYTAVKVNKFRFRIGDCAYFTPNSEDSQPYVGQITRLWQTAAPEMQMMVQCVWYYHPEDTHTGRTKKHHKQELFLSDLSDVNNVNSLLSPVEVLSYPEYSKKIALPNLTKKELKDIFFCRTFYDENNHTFYNLEADDNGSIHIEGLKPAADPVSTVKHWPATLQYTPTLLWRDLSEQVKDLLNSKANALVEIRPIQSEESPDNNNRDLNGAEPMQTETDFGVFAATDIAEPTTLGEFTGFLINNTADINEDSESTKPAKFVRTLYEDHEVLVHVDATHAGNEFRMLRDSSQTNRKPNARFQSTRVDGKWHLFVVSTTPIKKGEEILADYTVNYYSSLREEEEAFDNVEHREDEFDQPSLPSENPGTK